MRRRPGTFRTRELSYRRLSAAGLESGGLGFESLRARQLKALAIKAQSPIQARRDVTWEPTQVTENGLWEPRARIRVNCADDDAVAQITVSKPTEVMMEMKYQMKTLLDLEPPLAPGEQRAYVVGRNLGNSEHYMLMDQKSNRVILHGVPFEEIAEYLDERNRADGQRGCSVRFLPDVPEALYKRRAVRQIILDEQFKRIG